MEKLLKESLDTNIFERYGGGGGGCINHGQGYKTDCGIVFIKSNEKDGAERMFTGEYASLEAISNTNTVRAPKPIKVIKSNCSSAAYFVAEYIEMNGGRVDSVRLGTLLARMHCYNGELLKTCEDRANWVTSSGQIRNGIAEFGFDCTTCCGYLPLDNHWSNDWIRFYSEQRLKVQIDWIVEKYGNREILDLWSHLQLKIPQYFSDCPTVTPALLHGDLWSGNVSSTDKNEPGIVSPWTVISFHYKFARRYENAGFL